MSLPWGGHEIRAPPERTVALSVPSEILKHHRSAVYSHPSAPPQHWSQTHTRRGALLHPNKPPPPPPSRKLELRKRRSRPTSQGSRGLHLALLVLSLSAVSRPGTLETRPEVPPLVSPGPAPVASEPKPQATKTMTVDCSHLGHPGGSIITSLPLLPTPPAPINASRRLPVGDMNSWLSSGHPIWHY